MKDSNRKALYSIMALLVSIGAWMFVVYNYYPMTDVKYSDVPIRFEGQRDLAARGLAVSETSASGITVRLSQRRVNYNNISSKDINVIADVSECVAGDNLVSVSVSGPPDTSVTAYDSEGVDVKVERTASEYLDIDVIYSEGADASAAPIVSDIGWAQAEVVCAESLLPSVKKIAAILDYREVGESIKSYTANLAALDENGKIVPNAVIYPEEISLDASAGAIKTVDLKVPVISEEDEDYERTYTAPDKVTIIGPVDSVSAIDSIETEEININYYYSDTELLLECNLPKNVYLYDEDESLVLNVKVVKKEKTKTDSESESKEDSETGSDTESDAG